MKHNKFYFFFNLSLIIVLFLINSCNNRPRHAYSFKAPRGAKESHPSKVYNKALSNNKPIIVVFTVNGAT